MNYFDLDFQGCKLSDYLAWALSTPIGQGDGLMLLTPEVLSNLETGTAVTSLFGKQYTAPLDNPSMDTRCDTTVYGVYPDPLSFMDKLYIWQRMMRNKEYSLNYGTGEFWTLLSYAGPPSK